MLAARQRWLGIDLIRLVAFGAITVYHASFVLWLAPEGPPSPLPTPLWDAALKYARLFAFSGFTLAFLCSFLFGFNHRASRKRKWLPLFLLLGWITFSLCVQLRDLGTMRLAWDIYPLLAIGFTLGSWLITQRQATKLFAALVSVATLWIPFWKLGLEKTITTNPYFLEVLVGRCPADYADWPVLPWLALILLGVLAGDSLRALIFAQGLQILKVHRSEVGIWIALSAFFLTAPLAYYSTPLGDSWSCFNFRQDPQVFWARFSGCLLTLRIAFLPQLQAFLVRQSWARFISGLAISKHFFLAYLIHFVVLFALVGALSPDVYNPPPWLADLVLIACLPLTELATRAIIWVGSSRQKSLDSHKDVALQFDKYSKRRRQFAHDTK